MFDILNSLLNKNKFEVDYKKYSQYSINNALSQNKETLIYAVMSDGLTLSNKNHYLFLFNLIPKMGKQYGKWAKAKKYDEELVTAIRNEYNLSSRKSKELLFLVDKDQRKVLINKENNRYGGIVGKK